MAKQRKRPRAKPEVPTSEYRDADGTRLLLRGVLTPATRQAYADTLSGGLHQEDALARATELLFERLVVSWTIADVPITRQQELLGRYRMASASERAFVRDSMRAHLAEYFPEMQAP